MNLMELPEDTSDDFKDDTIIAATTLTNWQRIAAEFTRLIGEMKAGRLVIAPNIENRGIIGPQFDGLIRADIELLLMPIPGKSPSNRRRSRQ